MIYQGNEFISPHSNNSFGPIITLFALLTVFLAHSVSISGIMPCIKQRIEPMKNVNANFQALNRCLK